MYDAACTRAISPPDAVGAATTDLGPFDVLVLDDDVNEPKPSPEGILLAVSQLGVAADAVMYVGDNDSGYFPFRVTAEQGTDRVYRHTGLENQAPGTFTNVCIRPRLSTTPGTSAGSQISRSRTFTRRLRQRTTK